jgi:ion channel POLLUX/CASTOR
MRRGGIRRRMRYWFDNTMAQGTGALIGWLALCAGASVLVITILAEIIDPRQIGGEPRGAFGPQLWDNIVATFDLRPADVAGHAPYLFLRLVMALIYVFVAGALISLLTAGFGRRMEELRRGRSVVVERDHTVVLGWSDQVFTIVSELVEANANQRRGCVAILADRDKVDMERDIRVKIGHTRGTRVVCRTGSPLDLDDLELVNPGAARAIIVPTQPGANADAHVVKTLLAVVNGSQRRNAQPHHLIATVRDQRNAAAARLAGGSTAQVISADDVAARLVAQTSRQAGLSIVYAELLDFAGDEIYMAAEPRLTGRAFGDVLHCYRTSAVLGLLRSDGQVALNPPMDTELASSDQVIAVSEDDDTVIMEERTRPLREDLIAPAHTESHLPEKILILGWNRCAQRILRLLDKYVAPGSVIHVVSGDPDAKPDVDQVAPECAVDIGFTLGDTTDAEVLEMLGLAGFAHVIVLCDDRLDPQQADSRTLITLLHLRDIASRLGIHMPVVSEMADDRNRDLAPLTEADDFIVSQKLISLLMTQISENRHLADVFADLFSGEGSEIYLKPAQDYVLLEQPVDFYTVTEAARRRNEVAIGYRRYALASQSPQFGVTVNPDKQQMVTFQPGDRIVVLSTC